jgi:hypothetical protein
MHRSGILCRGDASACLSTSSSLRTQTVDNGKPIRDGDLEIGAGASPGCFLPLPPGIAAPS